MRARPAHITMQHRVRRGLVLATCIMAIGCRDRSEAAVTAFFEANRVPADLLVHFTKASEASNRAVMSDTEDAMSQAGAEAEREKAAVEHDLDRLTQLLQDLHFADELKLLVEFRAAFAKYQALDHEIFGLALENTNLKAQRLSFGPAREAADAFHDALETLVHSAPAQESWRVRALASEAAQAVREIQVLQAPHIAEPNDAAMDEFEKRMRASEQAARKALSELETVARTELRPGIDAANTALTRFIELNAQLVALSRRNSNVRSLALSLGQKRVLTAACDARLHALADRPAQRKFAATR